MEEIIDFGNSIFHGVNGEFIAFDVDNSTSPSPLIILRQNSLSIEQIYKNGLSKKVHVVVKNHPFLLQVGLSSTMWDGHKIDFTRFPLDAKLVYDTEQLKEVNFVKMKPLEFKCHVNERGDQVTVELRPKVLTSQLEDMLFRVRIQALDSSTKQPIQGLVAYSESIKVVSKPEQVKKKKKASSQAKPKPVQKSKEDTKKEVADLVSDHLTKIESSCDVHQNLLAMLSDTLTPSLNLPLLEKVEVPTQKLQIKEEKHTVHPFEKAFLEFLAAYDNLEQFEKPSKIRKVMKNSSTRETETVTEMLEAFGQTSSMPYERDHQKQMDNNKNPHSRTCECANCPHREELKRIDDFYNRFLITADSIM